MGSVKSLNTENFSFTIVNLVDGVYTIEIKPTSKTGKDLFRFKKWGKATTMASDSSLIFSDVDGYEGKVLALAAI